MAKFYALHAKEQVTACQRWRGAKGGIELGATDATHEDARDFPSRPITTMCGIENTP
jgi:hypothetical protein